MVNEDQARWRLIKANHDLAEAITSFSNRKFAEAYGFSLRVQETMRLMLNVDNDLTAKDRDEDN